MYMDHSNKNMNEKQIPTIEQAPESKSEKYPKPEIGERVKGEEHSLACAHTVVSWILCVNFFTMFVFI